MIGTLTDLARLSGMPSENTLRGLILADPDFAGIIRRGIGKGDPWEIDLPVAAAHIVALADRKAEEEREREAQRQQLAMDLGLTRGEPMPAITSAERKAMYEEELLALKIGRERGVLIDKASVEAAMGMLLVDLKQQFTSFSARLGRRVDLPRALQNEIDRLVEADLRRLAGELRKIADTSLET